VEQRVQFAVSRRSLVFSDHTEYRGVRVALVGDEIAKPLQHARIGAPQSCLTASNGSMFAARLAGR